MLKTIVYLVGLFVVTLIIKALRSLTNHGYAKTSSILKFNLLLLIPAVLGSAFVMSRFYTSPYSSRFDKTHGDTDAETIVTDCYSGTQFVVPVSYFQVEFANHFDVVVAGYGDEMTLYEPTGRKSDGLLSFLFHNGVVLFFMTFILIEALGNLLWTRRINANKKHGAMTSKNQPAATPLKTQESKQAEIETDALSNVDAEQSSGTLCTDKNVDTSANCECESPSPKVETEGFISTREQHATISINQTDATDSKAQESRQTDVETDTLKYVDLGLPSGTLWADRNMGASAVYDCGKLCSKAEAKGCLPTYDQCAELIEKCEFASCLMPDSNGMMCNCIKVTGPNDNSIFFPCTTKVDEAGDGKAMSCWCDSRSGAFSAFMLFQLEMLGILDFASISNLTIGMTSEETMKMVRTVKQ